MLDVTVERIDDVPLLIQQVKKMRIAEIIDSHIHPHGNWGGISLGETVAVWVVYLVSQGDHRLCAVEEWAEGMVETLRALVNPDLRPEDLSDDRLGRALNYLSGEKGWEAVEEEVDQHLLRVYELPQETVRLDTSTVSTYADREEGGLVQFGFSKDHRPDLPQVKVMLATLDPLGMPLATQVVAGNRADDPLYMPAIKQVHKLLGAGKLYVGDSKMAALQTRAAIHQQGDIYLCPAPLTVVSEEEKLSYVRAAREKGESKPWQVERPDGPAVTGEGFRVTVGLKAEVGKREIAWKEERWVLRSTARHEQGIRRLEKRLKEVQEALEKLNERGQGKRRYRSREALEEKVKSILQEHEVEGLLEVRYRREVTERLVRGYKGKPDRVERQEDWFVGEIIRQEEAIAERKEAMGWRVYLTNGEAQGHPLGSEMVVAAYYSQYRVEQGFRRMKGKPVGITPLYVHTDAHRVGLVHLFSLGKPEEGDTQADGGTFVTAFRGVNLSKVKVGERVYRHMSPLSEAQKAILRLLGFSERVYTKLAADFPKPP